MEPISIMAGAAVLGGLVQLYNSEKARGAEADRLRDIEDRFNQLKPPDYDLSIQDPPKLHQEMLALPKFSSPQAAPQFNLSALTPQLLKEVGQLNPEVPALVQQAAPELVKNSAGMDQGRAAQMKALQRYTEIGEGEFDPEYQEMVQKASRSAQTEAQKRTESILDQYRRRGISGSGLELAAQLGGSADAMDRLASTNQSAATQAYQNRMNALAQGAQLGSNIYGQDQNQQQINANILNSFNDKMASRQQDFNNNSAQMRNQAAAQNLSNRQRLADANVNNQNQAAMNNRDRGDNISKYLYGIGEQNRQTADQQAQWNYDAQNKERAYQNSIAATNAEWKRNERDNQNNLKSKMYGDQRDLISGQAGISNQMGQNALSTAQDRNAALGGLSSAAFQYGSQQYGQQQQQKNNMANADLAQYQKTGNWMTPEEQEQVKRRYY